MKFSSSCIRKSHGDGSFRKKDFRKIGKGVVFEREVLVFHPERIEIGDKVYVGHSAVLKGYYSNEMVIGDHTWIGQGCFFHSAGGICIGKAVGIGPGVKILTSEHENLGKLDVPVLFRKLKFSRVVIKDGADIGVGSIILPGVTIGKGAVIGAGSVVTKNIPDFQIWAGVPARFIRKREPRG